MDPSYRTRMAVQGMNPWRLFHRMNGRLFLLLTLADKSAASTLQATDMCQAIMAFSYPINCFILSVSMILIRTCSRVTLTHETLKVCGAPTKYGLYVRSRVWIFQREAFDYMWNMLSESSLSSLLSFLGLVPSCAFPFFSFFFLFF